MATNSISSNTSMFSIGSDGKLNVSGISSGIDSKAIIDALVKARRQPAVQIETKVTVNADKISALTDFKAKVASVTTALDKLRGNPGSSTNVFNTKTVSGTTSAISGTASSIDSLLVVNVASTAQNMSHTIKVNQLATAHQVRTDVVTSSSSKLSDLGIPAGSFMLNGKSITISATDTLVDLKSKINNAGAGVSASIVSADSSTNYLVLTSNATGEDNAMAFTGNAALTDALGLTTTSGTLIKNQLTAANNAIIDVDGITGIERSSNSIGDVVDGVTLSLLKAEPGTTISLKVEPDLASIKTAMSDFVDAYNDVRSYVTEQRTASDRNKDGTIDDNEVGPLAYDQIVRDALDKLGQMAASSVDGAADGYASLGQVGIVMKSDYTLQIDSTILDGKLLTDVNGFKDLFSFQSNVSDSRVTVLNRGTATASGAYTLNITGTDVDGNVTGATWNGVAMTVNNKTLTAPDGTTLFFSGAANLGAVNGITVDMTRGLADQFYDSFNSVSKATSGTIDTQITQLQTQNTEYQDRVKTLDSRLDTYRTSLEVKYTAMEVAMARLATLQQTLQSYSDSLNSQNS